MFTDLAFHFDHIHGGRHRLNDSDIAIQVHKKTRQAIRLSMHGAKSVCIAHHFAASKCVAICAVLHSG